MLGRYYYDDNLSTSVDTWLFCATHAYKHTPLGTLKPYSLFSKCNVSSWEKYHRCSHTQLQQAATWTDTRIRCRVRAPWAQRHHCEGKSLHRDISTCHVPTEVLSAQIVEARLMFPRGWQLWVWVPCQGLAYHAEPLSPPAWCLLRGTMATIIYWMSASFPYIHPGWP